MNAAALSTQQIQDLISSAAGGDEEAGAQIRSAFAKAHSMEHELQLETIRGEFARSKFVAERLTIPADMAESTFGPAFNFEDGKLVARDGELRIFSHARPGELAGFDEALERLVRQRPDRDLILKQGTSARQHVPANGSNGSKVVSRAVFDAWSPSERMAHAKAGGTIAD